VDLIFAKSRGKMLWKKLRGRQKEVDRYEAIDSGKLNIKNQNAK
jgi:hypothetical protein